MIAEDRDKVQKIIGYVFRRENLLSSALTHSSGVGKGSRKDYQKLEFLGDSILDFVIAEALMKKHPSFDEGQLTRMRAAVVSEAPLAETVGRLGLNEFLAMGPSETKLGIHRNPSVMSDLFESVVAAIYLDGGMGNARKFILSALAPVIARSECDSRNFYDYKSILNEYASRNSMEIAYVPVEDPRPREGCFSFAVSLDGRVVGKGTGRSKKSAQQQAAKAACRKIGAKAKK